MIETEGHTVVWFYKRDELEQARKALAEAKARAAVYWGSGLAQGEYEGAKRHVERLEVELRTA